MSNLDYLILFIASFIATFAQIVSYSKLKNTKIKLDFWSILFILIASLLIMLNTNSNKNISRIFISIICIYLCCYYIYKDKLSVTLFYLMFCYIILMFYEILLSFLIVGLNIVVVDENALLKLAFSAIEGFLVYYSCHLKFINKLANKIADYFNRNNYLIIFIFVTLIFLIVIDFIFFESLDKILYLYNITILICFICILSISIFSYIKANKEVNKYKILLDSLSEYEKKIDDDRMDRHEILNNLLVLKSIKNKNSKEYSDNLNELIDNYSKKSIGIKNIYKLPSGLKGIMYYKIYNNKDINSNINISKNVFNLLEKIDKKDYILLCRVVSITLDNAIEASKKSKDKILNIDIYSEKEEILILIENSYFGKVDMNKIYNKNYTSKKNGSGLGLYICRILLKNSESISMEQYVENHIFTTKICVK